MIDRFILVVLVGTLAWAAPVACVAQPAVPPPILYRLTADSALTLFPTDPASPSTTASLRGTFRLVRQISPLDWQVYEVADLAFQATGLGEGVLRITGSGVYREGGRGPFIQRLQLNLVVNGALVALDSGEVPPGDGPVLDIEAKGRAPDGAGSYALHLVAVPELKRWHYRLIDGSSFLDDCAVCDRPSIYWPLRGGFDLVLIDENPLFSRYHVFDVQFDAGTPGGPEYTLAGEGEYRQGGEVALTQTLELKLRVLASGQGRAVTVTNRTQLIERRWPMLSAGLDEVGGTDFSTYRIEIRAAPFHEIWFSTAHGFTPGLAPPPLRVLTAGDLLADAGRLVRSSADLLRALGLEPGSAGVGIDALDLAAGGEVLFSLNEKSYSESLGPLSAGDLVSDRGRIAESNAALLKPFGFMPPMPDLGLDAVHVTDQGEVLFSVADWGFSEGLGLLLGPGDLLSNRGQVWRSAGEMLAAFHAQTDVSECGLDAVFVWPHGEVWFSLEKGFEDAVLGSLGDGDLLSDGGYVVFRNVELMSAFRPLEELANFGLNGLFVVSDAASSAPPLRLFGQPIEPGGNSFALQWNANGRVFQVERTPDLTIPFAPVSPLQVENTFIDTAPFPVGGFYRVRQW